MANEALSSDITFADDPSEAKENDITFSDAPAKRTLPNLQHTKKEEGAFDPTYLAAGALKNITLAPSLAAMVGAAYETASPDHQGKEGAGLPTNPFNWKWNDIKKRFAENLEEGTTGRWMKTGQEWTKGMTDTLGVNQIPTRSANQAMDILGTFVTPVPAGFLGGAAAKGVMGTLGRGATLLGSPVRLGPKGNRLNKAFAGRAGLSAGIGGTLDQGIRYGMDEPMMFSEEALSGKPAEASINDITFSNAPEAEVDGNDITEVDPTRVHYGIDPKMAAADKEQQEAEDSETKSTVAKYVIGTLVGVVAPLTWMKYKSKILAGPQGFGMEPKSSPSRLHDAYQNIKEAPITRNRSETEIKAQELVDDIDKKLNNEKAFNDSWQKDPRFQNNKGETDPSTAKEHREVLIKDRAMWQKIVDQQQAKQPKNKLTTIKQEASKASMLFKNRLRASIGRQVDSQETLNQAARAAEVAEKDIQQLHGMGAVDAQGQMVQWLKSGTLDNGQSVSKPMAELRNTFQSWDAPTQQGFIDYIVAGQSNFVRIRATAKDFIFRYQAKYYEEKVAIPKAVKEVYDLIKYQIDQGSLLEAERLMAKYENIVSSIRGTSERVKPDLWRDGKTVVDDPQIKEALRIGEANPQFKEMKKALAENNEALLDNLHARGVLSESYVTQLKAQFRDTDGDVLYIPGKSADELDSLPTRLARDMGLLGSSAKEHMQAGSVNLNAASLEEFGGIQSYLDPFNSSAHYQAEMLEHANRQVAQWRYLEKVLKFTVDDAGDLVFPARTAQELAMLSAREKDFFTSLPEYVGSIKPDDPNNIYGALNLKYHTDLPAGIAGKRKRELDAIKRELASPETVENAVAKLNQMNNVIAVQRNGNHYLFQVKDRFLKEALEFDTTLTNNWLKNFNFFKRGLTAGTTGKFSFFGPTSFVYNASIGSINKFIRSEGGLLRASADAINVWKDGIRGAYEIFTHQLSRDLSEQIAHTIATGVGVGAKHPEQLKKLQALLERKFNSSFFGDLQQKTGGIGSSGMATSEFRGNLNNVMNQAAPHIYKHYGANALPQFARIWNYLNGAMHEGVAFGTTIRNIRETGAKTANELRIAKRMSADLVGNTRLQGSSQFARGANASVPFYGAMLQAFYTLGKTYKKVGPAKFATRMSLAIGIPAALEAAYNSELMPNETFQDATGRKWTYREYYWKGFSPEQRAGNQIVFIPGKPPWEAAIQPIVPELGLVKGLFLDTIDAVFNFSDDDRYLDHTTAGFNRVFNIPAPIPVKAIATGLGQNLRLGPEFDEDGFHIATTQGQSRGNRVTPDDQVRFEGQEVNTKLVNLASDFLGTFGRAGVNIYENFNAGGKETPTEEKVTAGFNSLGHEIAKSVRTSTGLFSSHPNLRARGNAQLHKQVFNKKNALKLVQRNININKYQGTHSGETPIHGSDTQSPTKDPILLDMAYAAKFVSQSVAPYEKLISDYTKHISSLKTSLYNNIKTPTIDKGPITVLQRDALIDSYSLRIDNLKRDILKVYTTAESTFAERIYKKTGRKLTNFTFDGYFNKTLD